MREEAAKEIRGQQKKQNKRDYRNLGENGTMSKKRKKKNKAGYTAQDAPSMRTFHLRK